MYVRIEENTYCGRPKTIERFLLDKKLYLLRVLRSVSSAFELQDKISLGSKAIRKRLKELNKESLAEKKGGRWKITKKGNDLICGIDEAGRGPLIGDLIIAGALFSEKDLSKLKKLGVKDSKLLTRKQREDLFDKVKKVAVSYEILKINPKEIDNALEDTALNLNKLEAVKSALIINKLKPDRSMLDCPSNNIKSYLEYLKLFLKKDYNVKAEHGADLKHLEVGAASILAKVTRDREIEKLKKKYGDFGSGYPSDPKVQDYLKKNWNKHPEIFRKTWSTYKKFADSKNQSKLREF